MANIKVKLTINYTSGNVLRNVYRLPWNSKKKPIDIFILDLMNTIQVIEEANTLDSIHIDDIVLIDGSENEKEEITEYKQNNF